MVSPYKKLKRQKMLTLVFIISLIVTAVNLYFGYFKKPVIKPRELPSIEEKKLQINFQIFESPLFKELISPPKIEPAKPEEIKRENPFLPY